MCLAVFLPSGRKLSKAYEGMPPVRWASSAASSPMHRQTIRPMTTTRAIAGIAAAPIDWTANGTMPVTRMVPANPMTKAPHQLVPLLKEVATSAGAPLTAVPDSLMRSSPPGLGTAGLMQVLRSLLEGSDGAQVALQLPRAHFGMRGPDFGPLGGHEVVDVVPLGGLAEPIAQDVIGLEMFERVPQRHRHGHEPALGRLLFGELEEIELARIPGVQPALDAVEAGRHDRAERQVGVGGPVDAPVLDPTGVGHPQHVRPVISAVGGVDRRPRGSRVRSRAGEPLVGVDGRAGDGRQGLGVL